MIKVINAYEAKLKLDCVVVTIRTTLDPKVYSQLPIVSLTDPQQDLKRWMREDGHGTTFDTGCTVIVTNSKNLDKELENKFKNLMWIVLDHLPKGNKVRAVEYPVIEMYSRVITIRCPFAKTWKVLFYDK